MIASSASSEAAQLFEQCKRRFDLLVTQAMSTPRPTAEEQREITIARDRLKAASDALRRARAA